MDCLKSIELPDPDDTADDLGNYLETVERAEELDDKIEKPDALIDEIVYELYGLTDEESRSWRRRSGSSVRAPQARGSPNATIGSVRPFFIDVRQSKALTQPIRSLRLLRTFFTEWFAGGEPDAKKGRK